MQIVLFSVALLPLAKTVSAFCYTGVPDTGNKTLAEQKFPDICTNQLSGNYSSKSQHHACLPDGPNRWDFYIKNWSADKRELLILQCGAGLDLVLKQCDHGGLVSVDHWEFMYVKLI